MISMPDGAFVDRPLQARAPRFALGERVVVEVEGRRLEGWVRAVIWVGGDQPILCWVSLTDADGAFPEEMLEPLTEPA